MSQKPKTVLIVDDDEGMRDTLTAILKREYRVLKVGTGEAALPVLNREDVDLILLDVRLPGINGFEVLRRIRAQSRLPVVMLTARGEDVDRIVGLEIGADDYLPKPFNPRELVARIRAVLRRAQPDGPEDKQTNTTISVGDIEMDMGTRVVRRAGHTVDLTVVEYDLLEKLLRAAGRIVTREELVKDVLHRNLSPFDRSIDMHVSNLRKKLGHQVGEVERIKTVRGVGYIYANSQESGVVSRESGVKG
jgi:two-component system response regulator CpxR